MSNSADKHGGLHLGRRCFLKGAIAAATATLTASTAFSRSSDLRTLKFVHTHTGEHLVATYAKDGCYVPDCLARLNYFLRDFRTGDSHLMDPKLLDVLFDVQVAADRDDEDVHQHDDSTSTIPGASGVMDARSARKSNRVLDERSAAGNQLHDE